MRSAKTMFPIIPILTPGFSWMKTVILASIGGWMANEAIALAFQIEAPPQWYQSPLVAQALITAGLLLVGQLAKLWWDGRQKKIESQQKGDEQHLTFSSKLQELTAIEREQLLGGLKELHKQEVLFEKSRRQMKEMEAFEARVGRHRAWGEISRLVTYIFTLHGEMNQKGFEFPPFEFRSQEDLMEGVQQQMEEFRKTLVEQSEEIHRSVSG